MAIEIPSSQNNQSLTKFKDIDTPDLTQSKYNFRYLVFPNDLGREDVGHYMVININAPTKFNSREYAGDLTEQFTRLTTDYRSKVDRLRYGSGGPLSEVGDLLGGSTAASIPRATRRIAESIALHMPSPLIYHTQNVYEEISLTALGGRLGIMASPVIASAAKAYAGTLSAASRLPGIATALGQAVGVATKLAQTPINPMIEILFSNTTVRTFVFEVLMAPRNEQESFNVKEIVKTLRFHAAPELNSAAKGFLWIPPAEFDISFYNKGVENMNILRINTCVLERIEVDYAPTGTYSTFRNGHPVAVRMSLGFRELEPVHKKRVLQGF